MAVEITKGRQPIEKNRIILKINKMKKKLFTNKQIKDLFEKNNPVLVKMLKDRRTKNVNKNIVNIIFKDWIKVMQADGYLPEEIKSFNFK